MLGVMGVERHLNLYFAKLSPVWLNSELPVVEPHSGWTSTVQDNFIKWCLCPWLWEPRMDVFEVVGYSSIGKSYSPVEADLWSTIIKVLRTQRLHSTCLKTGGVSLD